MEHLIDILRKASASLEDGWLYLPDSIEWVADTLGMMIDVDNLPEDEIGDNDEPLIAKEKGLISTLDAETIIDIFSGAKNLSDKLSDELLLEAFLYYYHYDAFLPRPGYKPPPLEEIERKLDREFYDSLGDERTEVKCKIELCKKGAIVGGVLCKVHHFEMIKNKTCPFMD